MASKFPEKSYLILVFNYLPLTLIWRILVTILSHTVISHFSKKCQCSANLFLSLVSLVSKRRGLDTLNEIHATTSGHNTFWFSRTWCLTVKWNTISWKTAVYCCSQFLRSSKHYLVDFSSEIKSNQILRNSFLSKVYLR